MRHRTEIRQWRAWTGRERRILAEAIRLNRARGVWDRARGDYVRRLEAVAVQIDRSYQAVRHQAAAMVRRGYV